MTKIKTIKLNGKTDYAKVATRLAEFISATKNNSSIKTQHEFSEGYVIFKATITPDITNPERIFTGTSLGKLTAVKAFEKLETIAVGRALAFAGYLSDGEIASSEEMIQYNEPEEIDVLPAIEKLGSAKNIDEVKKVWLSLTQQERENTEIENVKNQLKEKYENTPSRAKKSRVA